MSRALSANALAALYAPETGECLLTLATLSHPSLPVPIRIVNNSENVVHGGDTFTALPFELVLAADVEERAPEAKMRVANAERTIVQAIRSLSGDNLEVEVIVVLGSTPDVTEAGPYRFKLQEVEYDAEVVSGTLRYEDVMNMAYPADEFNPSDFPGLF